MIATLSFERITLHRSCSYRSGLGLAAAKPPRDCRSYTRVLVESAGVTRASAAASYFNWWQFDAQGGLFLGVPVDLYLSWAWLWGFVFAIGFPDLPFVLIACIALAADLR
jgi:hypothetical protein